MTSYIAASPKLGLDIDRFGFGDGLFRGGETKGVDGKGFDVGDWSRGVFLGE